MDNSVKRNGILSSFKKATSVLALLITILSSSVDSANIPNTTLQGKCEYLMRSRSISCSSYTEIPTNLANALMLLYLHMENRNNIDTLKNGSLRRSGLFFLRILNVRNCKIRIVEQGAFAGSRFLIAIFLSGNLITVLNPDIFADVPRLNVLQINNNPISIIEQGKAFPDLLLLTTLNMSNCKLGTISANTFDNLKSLRELDLSGNKLERLDWRVFQRSNNLTQLSLKNNPWHCDCHVKFLMETLKNMSLSKVFENITCTSAEIPKWKGELWNQVPEEDMVCHPEVNKLVFSGFFPLSKPNKHGDGDRLVQNETLQLGQDLYFECEYSGFPKPEVQWFKDNQLIIRNINGSNLPPKMPTDNNLKVELVDGGMFRYQFRDVLALHQIKEKDKGTYTCTVVHNRLAAHKTVTLSEIKIPHETEGNTIWRTSYWKLMIILPALLLVILLIAAVMAIVWMKKGNREKRGIIEEPSIDLEELDIKPYNPRPNVNVGRHH